jgi:hypothetical protein
MVDLSGIDQVPALAPAEIEAIPFGTIEREPGDGQRLALGAGCLDPIVGSTGRVAGAAAVKTAFDTLKSAIGLVKEAKDLLPADDQREKAIAMTLDLASTSAKIAEAEMAKALGTNFASANFRPRPC